MSACVPHNTKYQVVPMVECEYRAAIISLWQDNLAVLRELEGRFKWLYNENPYGSAQTWLLLAEGKEFVGCASVVPRKLFIKGKSVTTWTAVDFAVQKGHRTLGPAIFLQKAIVINALHGELEFIFAHPNKTAQSVFQRVKYKSIGQERIWSRPLRVKHKLKRHLKSSFLANIVSFFFDALQLLLYVKVISTPHFCYKTDVLEFCDDRFDELWEKVKTKYGISTEKKSSYLNWRFANHKDRKYSFFCMFNEKDELQGYVAYTRKDDEVIIEDLLAADLNKTFEILLTEFSHRMKKDGAEAIRVYSLAGNFVSKKLRRLLFFDRGQGSTCFAFFHRNCPREYQDYILDKNNWFLWGDMDI